MADMGIELDRLKSTALLLVNDCVVIADMTGSVLYVNEKAKEYLNITAGSGMAEKYPDLWEHAQKMRESASCAWDGEIDTIYIGDEIFKYRIHLQDDGNFNCFTFVFENMTEIEKYKKITSREQEHVKELHAIINTTSDGIWVCDAKSRVTLINPSAERINSVKAEEVIGKTMYELVEEGFIDRSAVIEVIKTKAPISLLQYREGRKIASTGTPVFDKNGELMTVVVSTQDVTELDNLRRNLDKQEMLNNNYRSQIFELQNKLMEEMKIIAKSQNVINAFQQAIKASSFDVTVLLLGESGTGKGLFAKLIHKNSKRANFPFVSINCGAIPESLVESELFGYDKGAFTGAQINKPGLFEVAEGGVLFLDEIGELPLKVQVKLLKFIEEGIVTRLGSTTPKHVNVKMIAATHKDLKAMVGEKTFREDLYYRLNVIPIFIPPLRERKECLLPMIHHYIEKICNQYNLKKRIDKDALDCLLAYRYPGNVRQLINICERLVVMTGSSLIRMEDLPEEVLCDNPETNYNQAINKETSLKTAREDVERLLLVKAKQNGLTQMEIAKKLGISQTSVVRKLRKYAL